MARFRLSRLAEADLAQILATSEERWGTQGSDRYRSRIGAAIRKVAADPYGPTTRDRSSLSSGIRSFHIRHTRGRSNGPGAKVKRPVHVLYYRAVTPDLIEIVRVLHERMEPSRHFGPQFKKEN
jgi:toxin ParE1/3/4